jgi:hypothetical protein
MDLIPAGDLAVQGRYICYLTPYATSHADLDSETATQEEVRNAARALVQAVKMRRTGAFAQPDEGLKETRQK